MSLQDLVKKPYFVLKHNHAAWFYLFNWSARKKFEKHTPALNPVQERIVRDLKTRGIAFTTLNELCPEENMFEKLARYKESLGDGIEMKSKKTFLKSLWDAKAEIDLSNPFIELSLSPIALNIANSYLKMLTRFVYATLNITLQVPKDAKAEFSQRWHRDPQEQTQLKMFIYLSDVTPDRGPFTYVQGSNYGNKYGVLFPQNPPQGIYPPEGAVETSVDANDLVIAIGKPGTVIFCDTSGLHRGGYATGGDRVMFTASYVAPSYVEQHWYSKEERVGRTLSALSEEQRFALYE